MYSLCSVSFSLFKKIFFLNISHKIRFHQCKSEEHELMCSHARIHCLNYGNGCPHIMQRQHIASHLPECPASVIVCNAEWNRWAFGSRERERISVPKGATANYDYNDLGMSLEKVYTNSILFFLNKFGLFVDVI